MKKLILTKNSGMERNEELKESKKKSENYYLQS
jgi:hypothetical protein